MTNNVIEKVLGDNAFYTSDYLQSTIQLAKSFIFKNSTEANRYNDYVKLKYPDYKVDNDPRTWRYYAHISGKLHIVDVPVMLTSVDNGDTFELTKASMLVHRRSRRELLSFGIYYEELVKRFPEQELYIRAVITDAMYSDIQELINLDDYMFTGYNFSLIEDNEHDVAYDLQTRIMNYKHIWLLPYYSLTSDLFLASQYHTLYYFIVTSLLAIRLENAKTSKAHSYHIRSYLASHHNLDEHMLFLNRKQQLFLYRNMLYLDNHVGRNQTFQTLIDVLFSERNISVVNYVHHQKNEVDEAADVTYAYRQKLLNTKPLGYSQEDKGLDILKQKEYTLAPGNAAVYDRAYELIDRQNKLALTASLLTKDLETVLIDETDTVKHKLLDVLTDYWAYMIKTNQMSFLVDYVDPVSNVVKRLNTKDLFKAYVLCLFRSQGYSLTAFPEYRIKRVFRQVLPTTAQLFSFFYDKRLDYPGYLNEVISAVPAYRYLTTSYEFSEFVTKIYNLNIGLWSLTSNYSDINTYGQMSYAIEAMHQTDLYTFNDETIEEFIERVGIKDVRAYTTEQARSMIFGLLDNLFDQKLTYQNRLKLLQKSLGEVFFKFNSYTVQLINNYYSDNSIVAGIKDTRYLHKYTIHINTGDNRLGLDDYSHWLMYEPDYRYTNSVNISFPQEYAASGKVASLPFFVAVSSVRPYVSHESTAYVNISKTLLTRAEYETESESDIFVTQPLSLQLESVRGNSEAVFISGSLIQVEVKTVTVVSGEIGVQTVFSDESETSTNTSSSDPHLAFLAMNL